MELMDVYVTWIVMELVVELVMELILLVAVKNYVTVLMDSFALMINPLLLLINLDGSDADSCFCPVRVH